jgi:hypothetical protein
LIAGAMLAIDDSDSLVESSKRLKSPLAADFGREEIEDGE